MKTEPCLTPPKTSFNSIILIFLIFCVSFIPLRAQDLDVPYVPTPQPVVEKMLDIADVRPGDYVIDLGSGDGRIVITAVKRGAYGHGIDLDPERIKEARENAQTEGVADNVMFFEQNIFDTDFSRASVITMYLLNSVNRKLRPQLLEALEPGTRIVSHSFNMGEWKPDSTAKVKPEAGSRNHSIYFWVIPARVEGDWSWQVDGQPYALSASQQYQQPSFSLSSGGSSWTISDAKINGKRVSFKASNGTTTQLYSGRIEGGTIKGIVQVYNSNNQTKYPWNAAKN
ncbi:MAG: class I SAM-dependent methyltransferase [Balneolaceae bacterium]|nr:class I SAM-dependent methyltransferase [Balneolaceae bacterium]